MPKITSNEVALKSLDGLGTLYKDVYDVERDYVRTATTLSLDYVISLFKDMELHPKEAGTEQPLIGVGETYDAGVADGKKERLKQVIRELEASKSFILTIFDSFDEKE